MTRRVSLVVAAAVAALLVVGGVVAFLSTPPAGFGWFAYSPLSDEDFAVLMRGAALLSRGQAVSVGVGGLGVVLAAGVVGFVLGARTEHRRRQSR